jgi:asparagine synthase (glutamine-hydrolysing)
LLQAQYVDLQTWLSGGILTKVDRAAMANSLEVRAPLLDFELVEWGLSLPTALKLRGGEGKYIFKRAVAPYLPPAILARPKQGFSMSLAPFFRSRVDRLRARLLGDIMLGCGLFSAASIAQLINEHEHGHINHSDVLWLLLVFEGFLATEMACVDDVAAMLRPAA